MGLDSSPVAVTSFSDFKPVSSNELLDIQAIIECGCTLKRVRDVTSQEHTIKCTIKISTQNIPQSFGKFRELVECCFTN